MHHLGVSSATCEKVSSVTTHASAHRARARPLPVNPHEIQTADWRLPGYPSAATLARRARGRRDAHLRVLRHAYPTHAGSSRLVPTLQLQRSHTRGAGVRGRGVSAGGARRCRGVFTDTVYRVRRTQRTKNQNRKPRPAGRNHSSSLDAQSPNSSERNSRPCQLSVADS